MIMLYWKDTGSVTRVLVDKDGNPVKNPSKDDIRSAKRVDEVKGKEPKCFRENGMAEVDVMTKAGSPLPVSYAGVMTRK